MIIVDETDPVEDCQPSFPYRDVSIRLDNFRTAYDVLDEIGRGKFGLVYRCKDRKSGLMLAAKVVTVNKKDEKRDVRREVDIMRQLRHPRVIQIYDCIDDLIHSEMCLILEMVSGGELFDRVIEDEFILTEKACAVFVRQICEGIEYIHSKNILHLDMKPENVMCTSKTGNRIKIIDFGLARCYDPSKKLQVLFGTPEFVAPEVVNFEDISYATDMWSIGVITYVLLSGLSPFMGDSDVETMANVTIAKYDFDDESFDDISSDAKEFITKLLVKDKRQRMPANECLKHPWLASRSHKQTAKSVVASDNVDHGIECELEFTDTDSGDGKLIDEIDMDKDSDGCRCGSSPEERSSSVYSSPSDISPTPPPSSSSLSPHLTVHHSISEKRPSLDLTKEHLKEFVSRWTDNPYLFDSPRGVITHINCTSSLGDSSSSGSDTVDTSSVSRKNDSNNNSSSTSTTVVSASSHSRSHNQHPSGSHNQGIDISGKMSKSKEKSASSHSLDSTGSSNCSNQDHEMSSKMECGLNIVSQIRRFSQQLHEELELMKKQCGSCNAIRKYSLSDVSVNAQ
ncbi:unnamed protein product [Orchesella dallaii]|uniref:Protein kinase domain-containing protein n=1 Tax=Orchesella dallaii TaxID=48710 RepID=A0ABP1QYS7_9HEXA